MILLPEVLRVGIIWLLKGNAADMARYLGLTPSVNAILDKLDSLYSSVSTFDVMMWGFYTVPSKSKFIAHYIARLEGKLNEVQVKHPNRVSKAETAQYIRDHLFYGLRKPLQEAIHAKSHNPMITWF